jgi:hypothetical protein
VKSLDNYSKNILEKCRDTRVGRYAVNSVESNLISSCKRSNILRNQWCGKKYCKSGIKNDLFETSSLFQRLSVFESFENVRSPNASRNAPYRVCLFRPMLLYFVLCYYIRSIDFCIVALTIFFHKIASMRIYTSEQSFNDLNSFKRTRGFALLILFTDHFSRVIIVNQDVLPLKCRYKFGTNSTWERCTWRKMLPHLAFIVRFYVNCT